LAIVLINKQAEMSAKCQHDMRQSALATHRTALHNASLNHIIDVLNWQLPHR